MLGFVDSFSDEWLAFLWGQTFIFMDLPMAELTKLAKMTVSCMRQITLTLSGAPSDYIDYLPMYHS